MIAHYKDSKKKEDAIERIIANTTNNLKDAFLRWKNNAEIMNLQGAFDLEKKRMLLDRLQKFANFNKNSLMRIILERFFE